MAGLRGVMESLAAGKTVNRLPGSKELTTKARAEAMRGSIQQTEAESQAPLRSGLAHPSWLPA